MMFFSWMGHSDARMIRCWKHKSWCTAISPEIRGYLRAAAPAADPGVHVREGKQLQRHKLDIIGGDMLDLFQLDEGFEESYTEVV